MRAAQSSHIYAHDYDDNSHLLTVQFTNGAIYHYHDVDQNTYYAFAQSSSPGAYLHSKIKGRFESRLVAPGESRKRK